MNLDLTKKKSYVMGILNITPDSFYDGGKYTTLNNIMFKVEQMIAEGMDIIDIRLISSSEYDQLISIDRSSMPPPGRWRELTRRNLGTDNWLGFILQPRFHLKDVQVIEVNIF